MLRPDEIGRQGRTWQYTTAHNVLLQYTFIFPQERYAQRGGSGSQTHRSLGLGLGGGLPTNLADYVSLGLDLGVDVPTNFAEYVTHASV